MSDDAVVHRETGIGYAIEDDGRPTPVDETKCGKIVYFSKATDRDENVTCPACLKAMKGGEDAHD